MSILNIAPTELLLILVLAVVVFGPDKLPQMAASIGQWVRDFRRYSEELSGDFREDLVAIQQEVQQFRAEMQQMQEQMLEAGEEIRGLPDQIEQEVTTGLGNPASVDSPSAAAWNTVAVSSTLSQPVASPWSNQEVSPPGVMPPLVALEGPESMRTAVQHLCAEVQQIQRRLRQVGLQVEALSRDLEQRAPEVQPSSTTESIEAVNVASTGSGLAVVAGRPAQELEG